MRKVSDEEIVGKWYSLKKSAEERKIPFALSLKAIGRLLAKESCYYTRVKFIHGHRHFARSFERVNSAYGYVDENVVVCTVIVNTAKSNLSEKELNLIVNGIKRFNKKKVEINPLHIVRKEGELIAFIKKLDKKESLEKIA